MELDEQPPTDKSNLGGSKMNGYEKVANYIERFWKSKHVCNVLCLIGTSFDGADYCKTVEIASPDENHTGVEFLNDWYEGEPYVKVFGIKCVDEIEFIEGEGIFLSE